MSNYVIKSNSKARFLRAHDNQLSTNLFMTNMPSPLRLYQSAVWYTIFITHIVPHHGAALFKARFL
jgi:hypothetical protein